jgi:hypothetical protein
LLQGPSTEHWRRYEKGFVIALNGIALFAALATPAQLNAQEPSGLQLTQQSPHYKLVFIGTLGGKQPLFYRRNTHSQQ